MRRERAPSMTAAWIGGMPWGGGAYVVRAAPVGSGHVASQQVGEPDPLRMVRLATAVVGVTPDLAPQEWSKKRTQFQGWTGLGLTRRRTLLVDGVEASGFA